MGKGEIARNEQFLIFPRCFLPFWRTFCQFHQIWNCRLQTLSIWKSLKFVVWETVKWCLKVYEAYYLQSGWNFWPHNGNLNCSKVIAEFENCLSESEDIVGKRENAVYQHFLHYSILQIPIYLVWAFWVQNWLIDWLIEWCFTPLSTVFQSYHGDSSHYSYLSWVSPVLGWALKCLVQGHPHKKPRGSSAARTQDPWIASQTLYHWATWDPRVQNRTTFLSDNCYFAIQT